MQRSVQLVTKIRKGLYESIDTIPHVLGMDLAHRRLTPDSLSYVSGGGMNCVSCDICVHHLGLCVCFSLGYSSAPE